MTASMPKLPTLPTLPRSIAGPRTRRRAGVIRIAKWGNCMAVRLPKEKARENGLSLGDEVVVESFGDGVLIRPSRRSPTLRELVAKITPANRHGAVNIGPAVGREIA